MKCYKCDKCGDVVLAENVNLIEIWSSNQSGAKYDLCPTCAATIKYNIRNNLGYKDVVDWTNEHGKTNRNDEDVAE